MAHDDEAPSRRIRQRRQREGLRPLPSPSAAAEWEALAVASRRAGGPGSEYGYWVCSAEAARCLRDDRREAECRARARAAHVDEVRRTWPLASGCADCPVCRMRQHPVRELLAFMLFNPEQARHPVIHIALAIHAKDRELALARFLLAHPGKRPPDALAGIFAEIAQLPLEELPQLDEILAEVQQLLPPKPKRPQGTSHRGGASFLRSIERARAQARREA